MFEQDTPLTNTTSDMLFVVVADGGDDDEDDTDVIHVPDILMAPKADEM